MLFHKKKIHEPDEGLNKEFEQKNFEEVTYKVNIHDAFGHTIFHFQRKQNNLYNQKGNCLSSFIDQNKQENWTISRYLFDFQLLQQKKSNQKWSAMGHL